MIAIHFIITVHGNLRICQPATPHRKGSLSLNQIDQFYPHIHSEASYAYPTCDRFGEIQTLKTRKEGIYRLLMAAKLGKNTVKMDTISVECRIMNSLADFELYEGVNFDF